MASAAPPPEVQVRIADLMALEPAARGLGFFSRQPVRSILAGQHGSRLRGRGLDFEELRRYLPGDDLRQLDWRASQRLGKPYVRTYSEERDRPSLVVVDQRMGMYFGSVRSFKSVVAARVAALSAWMAFQAGDRVGGLVFSDAGMDSVRPLRSRERIQALFAAIARRSQSMRADQPDVDASGRLNQALEGALAHAPHDCLVCLISDFAGADDTTLRLLRTLAAHNDVVATLVYDPLALRIPLRGRLVVTQGELQVEVAADRKQVREPLSAFFSGRLHDVAELLRRSRVPLLSIDTAEDTATQLRRELGRQASRPPPRERT
ncbi:DUF58 domain-containing protein [Achromobacter insolitus]|uniref:DUF58 domain-containing protein n=1 Tax=Achromobacter insolitus TaxID=217204 RepID=A0A6S7EVY5_9BURK|nr:DUF58 domain-containing protein [Achromobacter insolitus]AVG39365.1 DUF58 domain-containing protein [Achromobacter insolitus]AXA70038.1 DUF58 domain-containing protein [Achromobacter insolitus]CAB3929522.1 hypothetical protein LMG6000_00575 [Achromobacter insolitus]CAB3935721.1 hypothetical protein LMG5997_02371 [Achromobacter insolitus]